MGGVLGFGGSSGQDRDREIEGWNAEKNVFNYAFPLSKDLEQQSQLNMNKGLSTMDQARRWFSKVFSGSRPEQMEAVASDVNAVNQQGDALRRQQAAQGTGRTGGVAAGNQVADVNRLAQIDNMIFGARPQAAQAGASIGNAEANIAVQQLSAALRALGLSDEAIQHYIDSSMKSRELEYTLNRSKTADVMGIASRALAI